MLFPVKKPLVYGAPPALHQIVPVSTYVILYLRTKINSYGILMLQSYTALPVN